ncbi:MAG: hypothetical protein RSB11_04915, partial [Oscillospiraceae bacterium]
KKMLNKRNSTAPYRTLLHRKLFLQAAQKSLVSDNARLAALYLLTADKKLWTKACHAITDRHIDFSAVVIGDIGIDCYTLFMSAKDLSTGTKHITMSDLADTEIISQKMFEIICNAMAIRRYGMKAIEIAEKEKCSYEPVIFKGESHGR